jgi:PHD/YefM family antitoxin component YafN of YafNO toxin-antitoxin module
MKSSASRAVAGPAEIPLERIPASDVKQKGWRGVMQAVQRAGSVLVTNHDRPEAVILALPQYEALVEATRRLEQQTEDALELLRKDFDRRLASLDEDGAEQRMRDVFREPVRLEGRLRTDSGA